MSEYNMAVSPIEAKNKVLHESKSIMNVLAQQNVKEFLNKYCGDLYQRVLNKYSRLKDSEYRIAVAAGQSAGKSSIINSFVLEYPVLPFCNVVTTCVPTIIRYGKNIKLKVTVNETIEKNGKKRVVDKRSFPIYCSKDYISKEMFEKLADYFATCYKTLALENVNYFTKKPIRTYNGEITADDLTLSYDDPKHIAMLLLTVLCAYMENNESEDVLTNLKIEARNTQKELLKKLGLNNNEKNYSVTLYWDTPILEKGLVFYDLPGLGADNYANNGYESHEEITKAALEEVQSMLYVFKTDVTAEGLSAISTLMNMESIRALKIKQDRVIVALNKADLLGEQVAIDAAVDKARISIGKFNINPRVYPISAQIYGENLFVKNGYTKTINTRSISSMLDLVPEEQYLPILQKQLEKYPGADFYNALNDYADRSIVTNTLEYLKSLYQLVSKANKEIVNIINLYTIIGDDVTAASDEVYGLVKKLSKDILDTFKINSIKIIEDKFSDIEKQGGFRKALNDLESDLDEEMLSLNKWAREYVNNNLNTNKFKHIVLYRHRKKGLQKEEPNYSNWAFMNQHIKNHKFEKAFTNFTKYLKDLLKDIQEGCLSLNDTLIENLNKEFENIDKDISFKIEGAKGTLLANVQKSTKDKSQIESVYNQTLNILHDICNKYKRYTEDCVGEIKKSLTEKDNVDKLNDQLVKRATDQQNALNQEFVKVTSSLADNLKQNGTIRKKTYVVKKSVLLSFIDNKLVFSDAQKNLYSRTLNPESFVKKFCEEGEKAKKSAIEAPLKNLKVKLDDMQNILNPKSSYAFINLHDAIRTYIDMLDYINKGLLGSMNIDNVISDIKKVPDYKNEISNIEDISFDKLQLQVQKTMDTIKEG